MKAPVLLIATLGLCLAAGETEDSTERRTSSSSILNFVGALSAAPRESPKRSLVWSAEEEAGHLRGGNCAAPPPPFGPEAAGLKAVASGFSIDSTPFFSLSAMVGG